MVLPIGYQSLTKILVKVLCFPFSDHEALFFNLPVNNESSHINLNQNLSRLKNLYKMVLSNSKFNNVAETLFCTDWEQVFVGMVDDPEILFSRFFNKITSVINFHRQLRKVGLGIGHSRLQGGGHKKQSWYSTELAKMKNDMLNIK